MAERKLNEQLQLLYSQHKNIYSFSKANTINDCEYEAYLTYIKHQKGSQNCYSILGTKIHDCLESIMNNKATQKSLLPALQSELEDMKLLGISFPKDRQGGDSIKEKWIKDIKSFCNDFIKPSGKFDTEKFVLYKLSENRYIQGYIDLIRYNDDNTISIYDWKTSSQFNKKDLIEHGRQLVFYAIALESLGYKIRSTAWIMLKYVTVKYMGKTRKNSKNETLQTKIIERSKLIDKLSLDIKNDLQKLGYDDLDIECMLYKANEENSLKSLPNDVKNKYKITPYIRTYLLTDELKHECLDYINAQADKFESKTNIEEDWIHRSFTKISKTNKIQDDSFYCNNLCNHRLTCKYLKEYNDTKNIPHNNEDEDLFN